MFKKFYPSAPSIHDRMVQTDWRPAGFDYMRIVLAVSVILAHSFLIPVGFGNDGGGKGADYSPFTYFSRIIVPAFFALSGFLVAGSLERSKTLVNFMGLRVLRIAPALSVEVILSALILGPVFTTLTLGEYFSAHEFHIYFFNIIGEIHYYLPGVFKDHPITAVNGQLWTVPYELVCYVLLAGLAVIGAAGNRHWLLASVGVFYLLQIANSILRPHEGLSYAAGSTVVLCFICGVLVYKYRQYLVWNIPALIIASVVSIALLSVPNGIRFVALPLTYVTVYIGLLNPPKNKILMGGDYSYGIYLYGFPVQQALYASSAIFHLWYWNFIVATAIAAVLAYISWHYVEKPVMSKRQMLKTLEQKYLALGVTSTFHRWRSRFAIRPTTEG